MLRLTPLLSALLLLHTAAFAETDAAGFVRRALVAKGAEYQAFRPRLLGEDEEIGAALARAAAEGGSVETRWLAESLLQIRKDPKEAARLAGEYLEALRRLWNNPREAAYHVSRCGVSAFSGVPLLYSHEPIVMYLDFPDPATAEVDTEWRRSLLLPESSLWPAVLAEVLVKGWLGKPEPRLLAPRGQLFSALGERFGARPDVIDLYRFHALLKLADAGERRGFPIALGWLRRDSLLIAQRIGLAKVLARGRHKVALPVIVSLAGKSSTPWRLRLEIMRLLPLLGSQSALRTLATTADAKPANDEEGYVVSTAAIALERAKRLKGARVVEVDGMQVHVLATLDVSKWRGFPGQEKTTTFVLPLDPAHRGEEFRLRLRLAPPLEEGRLFRLEAWDATLKRTTTGIDLSRAQFPEPLTPRTVVLPLGRVTEIRLRWEGRCVFLCEKAEITAAW